MLSSNWADTKKRFVDWWSGKGVIIGNVNGFSDAVKRYHTLSCDYNNISLTEKYTNPHKRALINHHKLINENFPLNTLPVSDTDIGPGSLALFLGCEPLFSEDTVWFKPISYPTLDGFDTLRFNTENKWWQITRDTLINCKNLSENNYLVGAPDLIENLDILALLRGPENLMMDMLDNPDKVKEKLWEINGVWQKAYNEIYNIIKLDDGSSCSGAFRLWGPGKTMKVQCDESAMISTKMFEEFVMPPLKAQCKTLDNVMYHLDGTAAIKHLDALLDMEEMHAIEWTPEAGIESGGNKRWFEMYKKILRSGKSLQVVGIKSNEILSMLDALGDNGIYFICDFKNEQEAESTGDILSKHLPRNVF